MLDRNVGLTSSEKEDKGIHLVNDNNSVMEVNPNFSSSIAQYQNQVRPLVTIGEGGDEVKTNKSDYEDIVPLTDSVNTSSKEPSSAQETFDGSYLSAQDLHLEKEIGAGSFGKVFKGTYHGLSVAAKQLKTQEISNDNKKSLFEYEASRLAILNHPNVVGFYGFCPKDNEYYMVMEFCDGGSLWSALQKKRITTLAQKWRIALDMAQGLAYIHDQGTLHRDLKADNVLLDKEGRAKLADLGLAEADQLLTGEVQVDVASELHRKYIPFASPEECRGEESTKATDIYSFGVLLWQLFTVEEPYANIDLMAIEQMILAHKTPIFPVDTSILPKSIATIIQKCWELKSEQRPTAQQVFIELEGLASEFHPHSAATRILQRLDCLVHPRRAEYASYIPSYVSTTQEDNWDAFWRRIETKKAKEQNLNLKKQKVKNVTKDKNIPEQLENIPKTVTNFLEDKEQRSLLLLGESGVGKTLALYKEVADRLLTTLREQLFRTEKVLPHVLPHLPIFIRPGIEKSTNHWSLDALKDGINKALTSSVYNLSTDAIAELKQYPVLFIFDGYDELTGLPKIPEVPPNLPELLGLADWPQAKLVVACRSNTILSSQLTTVFGVKDKCHINYLLPFNIGQMLSYLERELRWQKNTKDTYRQEIQAAEKLRTILRNPFVLSLFTRSFEAQIKANPDLSNLSRFTIYQQFIKHWLLSNQKLLDGEQDNRVQTMLKGDAADLLTSFNQFASALAIELFQAKELQNSCEALLQQKSFMPWMQLNNTVAKAASEFYHSVHNEIVDKKEEQGPERHLLSEEQYKAMRFIKLRKFTEYAPIQWCANQWNFVHKSFYEYFIANHLIAAITDENTKTTIDDPTIAAFNIRYIQQEPEALVFWREYWMNIDTKTIDQHINHLFEIVLASKTNKNITTASANAITILNAVRIPFSGKDLSGVNINGANLNFALLDYVDFTGANLANVSLMQSHMMATILKAANLHQIYFCAQVYLKHDSEIYTVAYSPNGKLIATGTGGYKEENNIYLWDANNHKLINELKGHTNTVTAVAFNPSSTLLASGSKDKTCRLWDVTNPAKVKSYVPPLEWHTDGVNSVAFNPNGTLLASGSDDKTCHLWDVTNPAEVKSYAPLEGHTSHVNAVAFNPSGTLLVSGSDDKTCHLWDVTNPARVKSYASLEEQHSVSAVAFNPSGTLLASGISDRTCHLWDVTNPVEVKCYPPLEGHTEMVTAVAFNPRGTLLASGSHDKTCRLWDVTNPAQIKSYVPLVGHTGYVKALTFNPDGTLLVSGGSINDKTCRLWDVTHPDQLKSYAPLEHTSGVSAVAFNSSGTLFASGSWDNTCHLWDITNPARVKSYAPLEGHTRGVTAIAFNPSGTLFVSGSDNDYTCCLWDVTNPDQVKSYAPLKGHNVRAVAFNPSGTLLASVGSRDKTCRLWDVTNPAEAKSYAPLAGHVNDVNIVAFNPSGTLLVSGSNDYTCRLWDVTNPVQVKSYAPLKGHTSHVNAVAFNPSGMLLVSGSGDNTCRLWDVTNPAEVKSYAPLVGHTYSVQAVAFNPSGTLLVSRSADSIRLWDVTNPAAQVKSYAPLEGGTSAIAFNPSGTLLASGSWDNTCRLWDVTNPAQVKSYTPLEGHTGDVNAIAFNPSGTLLVSGSDDHTCCLWDVTNPAKVLLIWCSAGINLSLIGVNIENAYNLAPTTYALLKQRGAIGEPEPIEITVEQSHVTIKEIKGEVVSSCCAVTYVTLLDAVRQGHLESVQWCLKKGGANITEKDNDGATALIWAAWKGHLPVVKWLLKEGGANIAEKYNNGSTALLFAASGGYLEVVQWLLKEGGASIFEKNNDGMTALLFAAQEGRDETVQWLLQHGGASIEEKSNSGDTTLSLATENGNKKLVQWLSTNYQSHSVTASLMMAEEQKEKTSTLLSAQVTSDKAQKDEAPVLTTFICNSTTIQQHGLFAQQPSTSIESKISSEPSVKSILSRSCCSIL
jgi:WD40 repeat protein/serine/threonine protein kinase